MNGIVALTSQLHRRHHPVVVQAPEQGSSKEHGRRSRISSRVLLVALAGIVLLSMLTVNSSSGGSKAGRALKSHAAAARQLAEQQQMERHEQFLAAAASSVTAAKAASAAATAALATTSSKRHRKLEHGAQVVTVGTGSGGSSDGQQSVLSVKREQQQQEQPAAVVAELEAEPAGVAQEDAVTLDQHSSGSSSSSGAATSSAAGGSGEEQEQGGKKGDADLQAVLAQQAAEEREEELRQAAEGGGADDEEDEEDDDEEEEEEGGLGGAGSAAAGADGSDSGSAAAADSSATAAAGAAGTDAAATASGATPKGKRKHKSPYHRALARCQDLACLREAAKKERYPGQFLFPHFLILGWQKCATTSLFHHLVGHPSVLCPSEKEPEFFSYDCEYDPLACPADKQKEYIEETLHLQRALRHRLYRAAFEGSTHYAREGHRMAQGLAQVFPWVKLIASMREPISRGISMLAHNLDKSSIGCLTRRDVFLCLERDLAASNYSAPFTTWVEAFPREQIMLLQYESLTAPDKAPDHLRAVKTFLGVDPNLPDNALGSHNTRAERLGQKPEGWPMQRWQYERLIEIVRPDAQRIADIVTQYGFGDGKQWMHNWEAAWQANLNTCTLDGKCVIQLT